MGHSQQEIRDLVFETAWVWRLSPLEVEGLPISDLFEMSEQAGRIVEAINGR